MKFLAVLASTAFLLPSLASAGNAQMKYDNIYANGGTSLTSVACSDGQNGLINRYGYQTFSNLPGFGNGEVYAAAVDSVAGWNSPNCGSCYRLYWGSNTVKVIAVDRAGSGFNVPQAAFDKLTNGQAAQLGTTNVGFAQLSPQDCGLPY